MIYFAVKYKNFSDLGRPLNTRQIIWIFISYLVVIKKSFEGWDLKLKEFYFHYAMKIPWLYEFTEFMSYMALSCGCVINLYVCQPNLVKKWILYCIVLTKHKNHLFQIAYPHYPTAWFPVFLTCQILIDFCHWCCLLLLDDWLYLYTWLTELFYQSR